MNIGPYAVIKEVGHGGMGVVYEASDPKDSRTVAIKMIQSYAALDWRGRIGLVREARIAGQLCHPNIIKVYDIGQHKGWLYLVMEYLQGASLDRVIRSGDELPIQRKLQILIQLCDALNYAHTFGVVHRDVKPGNIFILSDGTVKVLDFGLATQVAVHDDRGFTGTIPYMSPEQVSRDEVDGRSDIWSAGVTMYELLTGRLPFRGTTATEVCNQILYDRAPAVDDSTRLACEFDLVFGRALAKHREARYPTAKAFGEELRKLARQLESTLPVTRENNARGHASGDSPETQPPTSGSGMSCMLRAAACLAVQRSCCCRYLAS
jgi:serine/threonine protein kinase